MNTKKKIFVVIIGIEAIVLVVVIAFLFYINSDTVKVNRQLELAQRYLLEEDYEQAIAAFEVVIEIDPKNVEAYLGLAEAYEATDDIENVVKILERGSERTDSDEIRKLLKEHKEEIEKRELAAQKAEEAAQEAANASQTNSDSLETATEVLAAEPEETTPITTGFVTQDGEIYYYDEQGSLVTGWFEVENDRYCARIDGRLYKDGEYEVDSKKYQFDQGGICLGEVEDEPWKQAYIDIINKCEATNTYNYNLIYLDNDNIPELLVVGFDYLPIESIYTYDAGKVYTIMDAWSPGNGMEDYAYIPRKNVIVASYATAAYWKEYEWVQNDVHELVEYLSYSLFANEQGEFDENDAEYYYYGREITEGEYDSYYIDGNSEYLYDIATKSAGAVMQEIASK